MRNWLRAASVAAAVFVSGTALVAMADEVHLANGSRLVGTVKAIEDGKLTIETDFAGTITVDMEQVERIVTEQPLNVELGTGEVAQGRMAAGEEGEQLVESEDLGARPLPIGNVTAAWGLGEESPRMRAQRAALEAAQPKWTLRLEAGLTGETGNNERINVNAGATARRATDTDRLTFFGRARFARENSVDTARQFAAGAGYEVDIHRNLFAYGRVEFEHDRFEDIEFRATGIGGLGYFILREPESEWKVRAGLGVQHESFRSDRESDTSLVGELGTDYFRQFAPWLLYNFSFTYIPTFDDLNDYRLVMENSAEIPLGSDEMWKIRAGVRNSYRGSPSPGLKRLDTVYFLNLVVDF
ncbi:MAG: DUF481 domain-containing protein [Phycisphaeraceae bacterium]|nr:DUF481 domain-containing protein [Phycisphaeraceae bacterium]